MRLAQPRSSDAEQGIFTAAIERGLEALPIIHKLTSKLTPPAYLRTTSFSNGFQALVKTYGTPRYRGANLAAFCRITFPVLFGVIMLGDLGAGLLLAALFGYWLVRNQKEWEGKQLNAMHMSAGAHMCMCLCIAEMCMLLSGLVAMCYGGCHVILPYGLLGVCVRPSGLIRGATLGSASLTPPMAWPGLAGCSCSWSGAILAAPHAHEPHWPRLRWRAGSTR